MKERRQSLQVETTLGVGLLTFVSIVLSSGVFLSLMQSGLVEARGDLATLTARTLATTISGEIDGEPSNVQRTTGQYGQVDGLVSIWVGDSEGTYVAGSGSGEHYTSEIGVRSALYNQSEYLEDLDLAGGTSGVLATVPVRRGGTNVGVVCVAMTVSMGGFAGERLWFLLSYVLISALFVAGFGLLFIRRRLVAPIVEINEATQKISSGSFGLTVSVDSSEELTSLSEALSEMSTALADYKVRTESQVVGLRQANEALFEAQDELVRVERLAAVGRMAAGVAHEIGNPLAAVIGYNQLLLEDHTDPGEVGEILERSKSELDRIRDILKELMDSASPESSVETNVDVGALILAVTERSRTHPRILHNTLETVTPDNPVEVLANSNKLHQVMLNLILNAADASGPGGIITVECRLAGTSVEIECRDNGVGFTDEALERGTEPFFTTKSVGEGRGLGLSTSQGFVKSLGGSISLRNLPDGGGSVTLSLRSIADEEAVV